MTVASTPTDGETEPEAAGAVGAPATDPVFDAMAQCVLTRRYTTTRFNHRSLPHTDFRALAHMHAAGFDGTFLQIRLCAAGHEAACTSADLVLSHVFGRLENGICIALIGAMPKAGQATVDRLYRFDVQVIDEYEGLRRLEADSSVLIASDPRLVITGLGAGLQEVVTPFVLDLLPEASVCTAGGRIDQYACAVDDYFPTRVHAARLGWTWRTTYESKRLTKRYIVETLDFVTHAPELIPWLKAIGSFDDLGLVGGVTLC